MSVMVKGDDWWKPLATLALLTLGSIYTARHVRDLYVHFGRGEKKKR